MTRRGVLSAIAGIAASSLESIRAAVRFDRVLDNQPAPPSPPRYYVAAVRNGKWVQLGYAGEPRLGPGKVIEAADLFIAARIFAHAHAEYLRTGDSIDVASMDEPRCGAYMYVEGGVGWA